MKYVFAVAIILNFWFAIGMLFYADVVDYGISHACNECGWTLFVASLISAVSAICHFNRRKTK